MMHEEIYSCKPPERSINFAEISAAYFRIRDGIKYTPCTQSPKFDYTGVEIYFKKDYMQETGSFKERGARNALIQLKEETRSRGVITASTGNFALALSYQGYQLGIPVTVVMPLNTPMMKVEGCQNYGARVVVYGECLSEARKKAISLATEERIDCLNDIDHPDVIVGAGTMGLEILEQIPDVDAVLIPVGSGGLLAGLSNALKTLKPSIKIIGVEPERACSFSEAVKNGEPTDTRCQSSIADGLVIRKAGENAYFTSAHLIDKLVNVNEESIALAMLRLVELEKAVVEGAGVVGLAAIISGLLPELKGKRVVIPLCGGNIDTTLLGRCLDRGLAADGRLVKFVVLVKDRPGGLGELVDLLHKKGVAIKDFVHDRIWVRNDISSFEVKITVETRSRSHTKNLFDSLKTYYESVNVIGDKIFDATCPSRGDPVALVERVNFSNSDSKEIFDDESRAILLISDTEGENMRDALSTNQVPAIQDNTSDQIKCSKNKSFETISDEKINDDNNISKSAKLSSCAHGEQINSSKPNNEGGMIGKIAKKISSHIKLPKESVNNLAQSHESNSIGHVKRYSKSSKSPYYTKRNDDLPKAKTSQRGNAENNKCSKGARPKLGSINHRNSSQKRNELNTLSSKNSENSGEGSNFHGPASRTKTKLPDYRSPNYCNIDKKSNRSCSNKTDDFEDPCCNQKSKNYINSVVSSKSETIKKLNKSNTIEVDYSTQNDTKTEEKSLNYIYSRPLFGRLTHDAQTNSASQDEVYSENRLSVKNSATTNNVGTSASINSFQESNINMINQPEKPRTSSENVIDNQHLNSSNQQLLPMDSLPHFFKDLVNIKCSLQNISSSSSSDEQDAHSSGIGSTDSVYDGFSKEIMNDVADDLSLITDEIEDGTFDLSFNCSEDVTSTKNNSLIIYSHSECSIDLNPKSVAEYQALNQSCNDRLNQQLEEDENKTHSTSNDESSKINHREFESASRSDDK